MVDSNSNSNLRVLSCFSDGPDLKLAAIWVEEAEKRLKAYRKGRLESISMEEMFQE